MKAKVTEKFLGVKDGEIYPVEFKPGDEIEGSLAAEMVKAGKAIDPDAKPEPEPKPKK
jgi:hypothetical protein